MTQQPGHASTIPIAFLEAISARYAVQGEIGRGGMSRVYLAEDLRHHRRVAIKILPSDLANALSKQRFAREIAIVARLTHPNILTLHDSGEAAGRLYYVMPFVEGRTLRELLRERGTLPPDEAVAIVSEIADALDYSHANGVVHRDIKPANILIVAGHAVVADFGIARAMRQAAEEALTTDQATLGTPAYMSPEQATPHAEVDGRTDIYSLGVVLYELLTGSVPFAEPLLLPPSEHGSLPSLRGLRKAPQAVPPHVAQAVRRALAYDPSNRFATAGDFARALRSDAPPARSRRAVKQFVGAGCAAAVLIAASWTLARGGPRRLATIQPHRVVVAQFADRTGKPELAAVGVMAADWLTEGLLRTGFVDAVPTATALQAWRRAKDDPDPVTAMARETNAGIVITGSYYADSSDVRIQVQVTDAASDKLIGAVGPIRAPLSGAIDAVEAVRSRVMGLLSTTLDSRLASAVAISERPPTFEAYREFSEGLQDYVASDFNSAATRFTRAYDQDTTFVTSLLMASISRSNVGSYAAADSLLNVLAPSRSQLTPIDRTWFDYRRNFLAGHRAAALVSIRALAAAEPGTKATYNLAVEAMQNGSLVEARRALESLPTDRGPMRDWVWYWDVLSRVEHMLGDYRAEQHDGATARELFPKRAQALEGSLRASAALGNTAAVQRFAVAAESLPPDAVVTPADLALEGATELRAHDPAQLGNDILVRALAWSEREQPLATQAYAHRLTRARLLYALQRWQESADSADVLVAEQPTNADGLGLAGAAAARLRDSSKAERFDAALRALPHRFDLGVVTFNEARIAVVLGRKDAAVALLRQSMAEGHEYDLWVHRDLDFIALRGYPPFEQIARPVVVQVAKGAAP